MAISDDFFLAFVHSSGISVECCCGVLHFCSTDGGDFEPGELEEYRARMERGDPKIAERDEWPRRIDIDGKTYVVGCACGNLERWEQLLWLRRRDILDFIEKRSRRAAKEAARRSKEHGDIARRAIAVAGTSETASSEAE